MTFKDTRYWYFALFSSYVFLGYLLFTFSFQNQVVPVWLPAGIGLVGCYLWWWRFFPAVFTASFIFNCLANPSFELLDIFTDIGLQNSLIACGATLQGVIGAALLRYWLGNPFHQWKNIKTLYFVFIIGFLVSLVSANIGIYSLSVFNPVFINENYWSDVIFWWLGDTLGILLTTPFLLSLLNYHRLKSHQRKASAIIACSVSALFLIVILLTQFFINNENFDTKQLIRKEVNLIENSIYRQINNSLSQLKTLATFIQETPNITRESFNKLASEINQDSSTLKAMSWNPIINKAQVKQHETNLFEIYQEELTIRGAQLFANDPLVYVKLISPEQGNQKAIGFNVYSNPSRKETLNQAMNNYHPKATPIIQLVQSSSQEPAFLLFYPVLESISVEDNESVKKLRGFATGVFLAEKLISNAINSQQQLLFHQIFEQGKKHPFIANYNSADIFTANTNEQFTHDFDVAGQIWQIKLQVNNKFLIQQQKEAFLTWFIMLVSIVTIVITSLLLMNNRRLALENIVNIRTKSLKSAVKEANYANKAKSQFLANMSHEIRTPLNSMIGFAQLAKDSKNSQEIKTFLEHINISSDLLLQIVNNILDIAKIESEKLYICHDEFDFQKVLTRIGSVFQGSANTKGLNWQLNNNLPKNILFLGDQTRIEQVLLNLCGNAMKFTQTGSVALTADLIQQIDQKAQLAIYVEDTGIGISADKIDKLFSPFTQADASTSRDFGGTGLGLTISKKLSHLMQGDIAIESIYGQGSKFTFTLTLDESPTKSKIAESTESIFQIELINNDVDSNSSQTVKTVETTLSSLNVLVAEDNRINQKLIAVILQKLGITATIVADGQQAIDHIRKSPCDVILMDCQMPILDGYEATEQIRAMSEFKNLPIFALTADVDTRSKERALKVGFDKHLSKPIDMKKLTVCLIEVMNNLAN